MPIESDAFELSPEGGRERLAWATRRGQPSWLWPDVAVDDWRDAMAAIEDATRSVLTGHDGAVLRDCDAAAFEVACYVSGMGPLLGHWLETGTLAATPPLAAVPALQLDHNRARMAGLTGECRTLTAALAGCGVAATVIKGMHTALAYFPEPGARPVSDVDLVIAPADEPRAEAVLTDAGFAPGVRGESPPQRSWRRPGTRTEPRTLRFVHADDPWSIDLQTSLDRRYSAGAPIVRLDGAVESRTEPWAAMPSARVLRQPLMLLQLAVHAGLKLSSLTMIRLVELTLVIRAEQEKDPELWSGFLAAATRAGALGAVYPALRLCELLAPGTVPAEVRAAAERAAPARVRAVVDPLRPADAQPILRCSVGERLMWTDTAKGALIQVVREALLPEPGLTLPQIGRAYYNRFRRIVTGSLTLR